MTNIQLKEVAIYSLDGSKRRIIPFEIGKLNIIYGASQTGKSAIIPIIDYCLCSKTNRIPAGTIRENCSAFAISLYLGNQYLLIKRIGDIDPQKILYAYSEQSLCDFNEDNWLPTTREKFKLHLNNALGISFSEIANNNSDDENDKSGRPSYRDLVSFNFQPQNIVANPNCLLYKTDIYKYRSRLQKIFDYAIGAQTSKQLYDDIQKQALEIELKDYQREKESLVNYNQKIINNSEALLLKAIEYGLLDSETQINTNDIVSIQYLLQKIAEKNIGDIQLSNDSDQIIAQKIQDLINKSDELLSDIRGLKQERNNISEILGLEKEYTQHLEEEKSRLKIAEFIKGFCIENPHDTSVIEDVNALYNNLVHIENTIIERSLNEKSAYEAKYSTIINEINEKSKKLNSILKDKDTLEEKNRVKSILENVYVNIIGQAQKYISLMKDEKELDEKIQNIQQKINEYTHDIEEHRKTCLTSIVNKSNSYVPLFAEFDKISEFKKEDLTVKVQKENEIGSHYLWETGSGSNWVAYHIASLLGFQQHFIKIQSPVFNFLIFDQPSQVYFPKTNSYLDGKVDYNTQEKERYKDKGLSDLECVQEMFKVMSKAINDNKTTKKSTIIDDNGNEQILEEIEDSKLQVIVLDHAGPDVWKNVEGITDVNSLKEWSKENPLVPIEWIMDKNI